MALETRPYGHAGDRVTVIGLCGTSLFKHSFNDGVVTVHRALELGVTYFDTSPAYGGGMTPGNTGLCSRGTPRRILGGYETEHEGPGQVPLLRRIKSTVGREPHDAAP